jgi:hypothetical protein
MVLHKSILHQSRRRTIDHPGDWLNLDGDARGPMCAGSNLNPGGASTTITFQGSGWSSPCTPVFITSSSIACTAPSSPRTNESAVVTVTVSGGGRTLGTATATYQYDPMSLVSVSPVSAPVSGASLILSGNFDPSPAGVAATVGGAACPITSGGSTQIVCSLGPGAGAGLRVTVSARAEAVTSPVLFAYQPPVITSLGPATGPSAGFTLTITGQNLFSSASVTVGASPCRVNSVNPTFTQIVCTAPPGDPGAQAGVTVTVGGQASNNATLTYTAPSLASSSPKIIPTSGGTVITITGNDFGFRMGTITVGQSPCNVLSWSATNVTCSAPPGIGANLTIALTTAFFTASLPSAIGYGAPVIQSVSPAGGPSGGGYPITIAGQNFFSSGVTMMINGSPCPLTPDANNPGFTRVIFTAPAGDPSTHATLTVSVGGQVSNTVIIWYDPPNRLFLSPRSGPTSGGGLLTVTGLSFGASAGSIAIGGASCILRTWAHSMVTFIQPAGSGRNLSLTLTTANGQSATLPSAFDYNAPVITGEAWSPPCGIWCSHN